MDSNFKFVMTAFMHFFSWDGLGCIRRQAGTDSKREVIQNGMDSNVNVEVRMSTSDGQNGFGCLSRTG
jgi:hypothetical protein